jgi:hypothetical protein
MPPEVGAATLDALLNPQGSQLGRSYPDMWQLQTAISLLPDRYIQSAASNHRYLELGGQSVLGGARSIGSLPVSTLPAAAPVYMRATGTAASPSNTTPSGATPMQQHEPLPQTLARPDDKLFLSSHQVLLRHQIEVFQATEADLRVIEVGQVWIRCQHCKLASVLRQRGSVYFPHSTTGIYQATQNMSLTHLQCGLCHFMPEHLRLQFAELIPSKTTGSLVG